MEFSEVEAISVTAFLIVSAAMYQGEVENIYTVYEGKKLSRAFYNTVLLPAVPFPFPALSF